MTETNQRESQGDILNRLERTLSNAVKDRAAAESEERKARTNLSDASAELHNARCAEHSARCAHTFFCENGKEIPR